MPRAPSYRVFSLAGREVLAVPHGRRRLIMEAVRCIPATGRMGQWARVGLKWANGLRLDGLLGTLSQDPVRRLDEYGWDCLARRLLRVLAREDVEFVITHPPQRNRQRFYVHVLSHEGTRLAFAKVSTDEETDQDLRREAEALRAMEMVGPKTFRVPVVLDFGTSSGRCVLLLEPLPARAAAIEASWSPTVAGIQAEVAGSSTRLLGREELSWWSAFQARASQVPELSRRLDSDGRPWEVQPAHGDFTNWNLHQVDGTNWLFDWESFAVDAPVHADALRYLIGMHTRALERKPRKVGRRLRRQLRLLGYDDNLMLRALAFLHSRGVRGAMLLARNLDQLADAGHE